MNTRFYANDGISFLTLRFENDVKVNGIQTCFISSITDLLFENDVKVNGIQTLIYTLSVTNMFENDVKVNGIQTVARGKNKIVGLRMM